MSIFNNHSAEILILLFFIITYVVSVLEKISDWKGTVHYYSEHFKKTIFSKIIPLLLFNVVLFETITLFLLMLGLYFMVKDANLLIAKIGLELSAITLLMFLLGQRLAKDYPGAMSIAVYFILNCFGIYLLT